MEGENKDGNDEDKKKTIKESLPHLEIKIGR